jgi:hypothetical protein
VEFKSDDSICCSQRLTGLVGQDVYFYQNHPVQFVYLCGLVLQIELAPGAGANKYALLTLDDGSGQTIEVKIRRRVVEPEDHATYPSSTEIDNVDVQVGFGLPSLLVDKGVVPVGSILKVKGSITKFRARQLDLKRVFVVQNTAEEVKFWADVATHRRNVLSRPWVLTAEQQAKADARILVEEQKASHAAKRSRKAQAKHAKAQAGKAENEESRRARLAESMDEGALVGSAYIRPPWV